MPSLFHPSSKARNMRRMDRPTRPQIRGGETLGSDVQGRGRPEAHGEKAGCESELSTRETWTFPMMTRFHGGTASPRRYHDASGREYHPQSSSAVQRYRETWSRAWGGAAMLGASLGHTRLEPRPGARTQESCPDKSGATIKIIDLRTFLYIFRFC